MFRTKVVAGRGFPNCFLSFFRIVSEDIDSPHVDGPNHSKDISHWDSIRPRDSENFQELAWTYIALHGRARFVKIEPEKVILTRGSL
jgi:hypothetical protein